MPSTFTIVMIVILIVLIAACIALYFFGKRAEKRQAEQQEQRGHCGSPGRTQRSLIYGRNDLERSGDGL